jgi:hypothetical protein
MQRIVLTVSVFVLALAGCRFLEAQPGERIDTLEEARARWADHRIESYSVYQVGCCGNSTPHGVYSRVVVRSGRVDTLIEVNEKVIKTKTQYGCS